MNADALREIVRDVFGRNFRTEESNGWLKMRCPLAQNPCSIRVSVGETYAC